MHCAPHTTRRFCQTEYHCLYDSIPPTPLASPRLLLARRPYPSGAAKMIAGVISPTLRRLGVAFIPALDRTLPQTVAASCPALTALDLTGSGQHQTTLPWVSLMTGCRGLRELRLNGMGGVTGWTPSPVRASPEALTRKLVLTVVVLDGFYIFTVVFRRFHMFFSFLFGARATGLPISWAWGAPAIRWGGGDSNTRTSPQPLDATWVGPSCGCYTSGCSPPRTHAGTSRGTPTCATA